MGKQASASRLQVVVTGHLKVSGARWSHWFRICSEGFMGSGFGPWPHSDLAESDPTFFFGDSLGSRPEARPWGFGGRCPVSQFRHHLPTHQRRWCLGRCLRTVAY